MKNSSLRRNIRDCCILEGIEILGIAAF